MEQNSLILVISMYSRDNHYQKTLKIAEFIHCWKVWPKCFYWKEMYTVGIFTWCWSSLYPTETPIKNGFKKFELSRNPTFIKFFIDVLQ